MTGGQDAAQGAGAPWPDLLAAARQVRDRAYAPYSGFPVGAAALTRGGRLVTGCNVENASYGLTLCAECTLVGDLHAGGGGRLAAVVCVGPDGTVLMPCGRCRQLLHEHGGPTLKILTPQGEKTMDQVLPQPFDLAPPPRPE